MAMLAPRFRSLGRDVVLGNYNTYTITTTGAEEAVPAAVGVASSGRFDSYSSKNRLITGNKFKNVNTVNSAESLLSTAPTGNTLAVPMDRQRSSLSTIINLSGKAALQSATPQNVVALQAQVQANAKKSLSSLTLTESETEDMQAVIKVVLQALRYPELFALKSSRSHGASLKQASGYVSSS